MGQDLVSYIVTGPREITKNMVERAAELLREDFEGMKSENEAWCPNCEESFDFNDGDGECGTCGEGITHFSDIKDAVRHIASLVDGWPDLGRDCASRENPDKPGRLIVVAGDNSWGDEPDGSGYQALKGLVGLPETAQEALGIK